MAANKQITYVRGKLFWAKIVGDPVDNYNKDGLEWVFDFALDDAGVKQIKAIKVNGKPAVNIRDKEDERGQFITLKQKYEYVDRKTGETKHRDPIPVVEADGKTKWDGRKIGNGTVADLMFETVDFGKGMYAGNYPRKIRILDLVPYEKDDFAPLDEDDEYYGADSSNSYRMSKEEDEAFQRDFGGHTASDDLNDDIPE